MNTSDQFVDPIPARNLGLANRKPEAAHEWTTLIEQNYESYAYYRGLLSTQNVDLGKNMTK
jgi:hypothetical protein